MTAELEVVLSWLGMSQYLDRFVQAGFDSWETLQEITEEDLELLEIGLGHRRKLQREIAKTKRFGSLPSSSSMQTGQATTNTDSPMDRTDPFQSPATEGMESLEIPTKRAYRHHPKADANAPERPYSAYVLFSNEMRERLKDENLSFPEISRQVGVRWQNLTPEEKEHWKQLAAGPWEEYKQKVLAYQKTDRYRDYKDYLETFKAEQTAKQQDRRPKFQRDRLSSNLYPTPGQTPSARATSGSHSSLGSAAVSAAHILPSSKDPVGPAGLPFGRVPARVSFQSPSRPTRTQRVCDQCRRKKSKCDGQRPVCGRCKDVNVKCVYSDDGKDRDGARLTFLSKKLDECSRLLTRVKSQVRPDDQRSIQATLQSLNISGSSLRSGSSPRSGKQSSGNDNSDKGNGSGDEDSDGDSDQSIESDDSAVGSMGSTDHVNQDDFGEERTELRSRAFVGNGSELQWIRRLQAELNDPGPEQDRPLRGGLPPLKSHFNTFFAEDMDQAVIGNQIDPFGLPIKSTADQLVNSFFGTIHLALPVLDRTSFLRQYKLLSSTWYAETFEDRMFITMLQLVFAIGAVHAHFSGSEGILDDRDHLLYSTRARILAVDSGILNDIARVAQVQVFALGAIYCLVSDRLERSWYMCGLSIRCAQALGLHLENVTPSMPSAEKRFQAQLWFALVTFERCLCMMTGRPTMVHSDACTISLPTGSSENRRQSGASAGASSQSSRPSLTAAQVSSYSSFPVAEDVFFGPFMKLASLVQDIISQLYGPVIQDESSSEVRALMENFDRRLTTWHSNLEDVLKSKLTEVGGNVTAAAHNAALSLFFHSVRIIIHRPCLCRRDPTSANESIQAAVGRCLHSARSIISILRNTPISVLLHHSPLWWMLLHHHKRALTVIILELAFACEHAPSQAEDFLSDSKLAIEWVARVGKTSNAASFTAISMARYLQQAARRVGVDLTQYQFDLESASFVPMDPVSAAQHQQQQQQQQRFLQAQSSSQPPHPQEHQQASHLDPPFSGVDPNLWRAALHLDPSTNMPHQGYDVYARNEADAFNPNTLSPSGPAITYSSVQPNLFQGFGFDPVTQPPRQSQPQQQQQEQGHAEDPMDQSGGQQGTRYPGDEFIDFGE